MSITEEMKNQLVFLINRNAVINDEGAFPKDEVARQGLKHQLFPNQFRKTQLCRYHSAGNCKSGMGCTFAHGKTELIEAPDLASASMCAEEQVGTCNSVLKEGPWPPQCFKKELLFRKQFKKTQLCRYDSTGKCKTGKACTFAHGEAELSFAPDLTKTSMCTEWKSGECKKTSKECKFAHGSQDLRMTPMFQACVAETSIDQNSVGLIAPCIDEGDIPTMPLCQISESTTPTWTTELPAVDIQHGRHTSKLNTPTIVISHMHFPVPSQENVLTTMPDIDQLESPSSFTGHVGGCLEAVAPRSPLSSIHKPRVPQTWYQ